MQGRDATKQANEKIHQDESKEEDKKEEEGYNDENVKCRTKKVRRWKKNGPDESLSKSGTVR